MIISILLLINIYLSIKLYKANSENKLFKYIAKVKKLNYTNISF